MGTDVAQNGILQPNGQYALLVAGMTAADVRRDHSSRSDMVARFNTAAFVPVNSVPRSIYGDAGRGLIYGPGDVSTDRASCAMSTSGPDVQLRGEFFNAFNQVLRQPNTTVSSTTLDASPAPGGSSSSRRK